MASAAVSRDSVRIESSCGTPVFLFQSILFLAALGLCSCVRAFSTCIMEWLPFFVVPRLLFVVASLAAERGF